MTYSAAQAIGLQIHNVPHKIKPAFTERAARALVYHGGDNIVRKYRTEEWPFIVRQAKQELQGHFDAEHIARAEFELR